jgi:hypothetical protein
MGKRAVELAERLGTFNNDVIGFVENCPEEAWRKVCSWEQWPVGVAARHIGAGHYRGAAIMAKMIVDGKDLPVVTSDQVTQRANNHAHEHSDCTKAEAIQVLREEGRNLIDFVAGLDDSALDRTGYASAIEKKVTAQQLIETMVLQSAGEHFANLKTAARS